jgi:hypothetical protein
MLASTMSAGKADLSPAQPLYTHVSIIIHFAIQSSTNHRFSNGLV